MKKVISLCIGLSLLFLACGREEQEHVSSSSSSSYLSLTERIDQKEKQEEEKTAFLELRARDREGMTVIEVWLHNPEKEPVLSLRSFLSFNPELVQGRSVSIPKDAHFHLAAPEEQTVDNEQGIVRLGLSAKTPTIKQSVHVADILFLTPQDTTFFLDFYTPEEGYQILDENMKNIAKNPVSPAFSFSPQE